MPNRKSFLVTEAERKHVRRRALFQQHRDASCQVFFSARQGAEGNSRHSDINIRGTCTIVCHLQKLGGRGKVIKVSYSPDLAPSDYHLFPGLKKQLKGRHFSSDAEVIAAAETWLDGQLSFFLVACKSRATG